MNLSPMLSELSSDKLRDLRDGLTKRRDQLVGVRNGTRRATALDVVLLCHPDDLDQTIENYEAKIQELDDLLNGDTAQ